MKNILLPLFLTIGILNATAQVSGGKYNKLFDEFLMEDYDGCYKQALKMTEKDEYRKEPEPYLYVAMVLLKYSEMPERSEEFPNAVKDAAKYAAKAAKYDQKERNAKSEDSAEEDAAGYYWENNQEFFNKLKRIIMDEAEYYFNEDNFSKAASTYKRILKVDPEDENILMITGASQYKSRNVGEGKMSIETAVKLIQDKYKDEDYEANETTVTALEDGVATYIDYLFENDQKDEAKAFYDSIYESLSWNSNIRALKSKF